MDEDTKSQGVGQLVYDTMAKLSSLGDEFGPVMRRLMNRCQDAALAAIENATDPDSEHDSRILAEEFLVLTELVYFVGLGMQKLDENKADVVYSVVDDDGMKN